MTGFQFKTWIWAFAPDDKMGPWIVPFVIDSDTIMRAESMTPNHIYIA